LEIDDRVITANGPSTAFDFALAILADSQGEDVARQVSQGTLYYSAKE
jgi:transcriptional regulator GlxA family with amidase domain